MISQNIKDSDFTNSDVSDDVTNLLLAILKITSKAFFILDSIPDLLLVFIYNYNQMKLYSNCIINK